MLRSLIPRFIKHSQPLAESKGHGRFATAPICHVFFGMHVLFNGLTVGFHWAKHPVATQRQSGRALRRWKILLSL